MLDHSLTEKVLPYVQLDLFLHQVFVAHNLVFGSNANCVASVVLMPVPGHIEEGVDWEVVDLVDNLESLYEITSQTPLL